MGRQNSSPNSELNWIITEDGSCTLYSPEFDENYHSLSGARGETLYNFIKGCEIEALLQKNKPMAILEVGLGLGLGAEEVFKIWKERPTIPLCFITLEINPNLVETFTRDFLLPNSFQKKEHGPSFVHYFSCPDDDSAHFDIQIIIGDARERLPQYLNVKTNLMVDAIFQDPFSPKKNQSLWTTEWFSLLKKISHQNTLMSTYSASLSVRKSMIQAGWFISNRKGFGKKKLSTLASLTPFTDMTAHLNVEKSSVDGLRDAAKSTAK